MYFVLSKRANSLIELGKWTSKTIELTKNFGLKSPETIRKKDDRTLYGLFYECSEEEYEAFKKEYNLVEEHNIEGIRFLKSS